MTLLHFLQTLLKRCSAFPQNAVHTDALIHLTNLVKDSPHAQTPLTQVPHLLRTLILPSSHPSQAQRNAHRHFLAYLPFYASLAQDFPPRSLRCSHPDEIVFPDHTPAPKLDTKPQNTPDAPHTQTLSPRRKRRHVHRERGNKPPKGQKGRRSKRG